MIIICVDDDEGMLATVAHILKGEQATIRTTTSAAQALDWITAEQIAVLVSDYNMPEMTGAQLAGYAKVIQPSTVRILLTAMDGAQAAVEGINHGEIFRYLSKPVDPRSLRVVMAAAIAKHRELLMGTSTKEHDRVRDQVLQAIELEYPGLTRFDLDQDGFYKVYEDPLFAAVTLGASPVLRDLLG
ncbi:MAG: response regulator [Kofleriaceae bacterium]|nr:response regulator [Kofleriaceae bacterium]